MSAEAASKPEAEAGADADTGVGAKRPPLDPMRIGIVGGLLVALGPVSLSVYMPALPSVVADLDTTASAVKLTMTSYFIGLAIAQLVCGPLSDAFGRKPVTFWFLAIFLVATVACAFAPTVEFLIGARFAQGFGASVGLAIARAIVRDGFTGEPAARLYNLIGLTLAIGPAIAPSIGAATLQIFDWNGVFGVMFVYGLMSLALVLFAIPETNTNPDRSAISPGRLTSNWVELLSTRAFMAPTLVVAMAIGGIHAVAAFMPFYMIEAVGLTPLEFALAMLLQTAAYVGSTLLARALLPRLGAAQVMRIGVAALVLAGLAFLLAMSFVAPSIATAMAPISIWMLGIAFVMPGATSDAMAPFPTIAGSASAMLGFLQLGAGFVGSAFGALFADPAVAIAVVMPAMAVVGLGAALFGRPQGEAATARAIGAIPETGEPPRPLP